MSATDSISLNLASALLAGAWNEQEMLRRLALAWGGRERWQLKLVRAVLRVVGENVARLTPASLAAFLGGDEDLRRARTEASQQGRYPVAQIFWVRDRMAPAAGTPASWGVPALAAPGALADWLNLKLAELDWFADGRGLLCRAVPGPLQHYTYRWLTLRRRRVRLLEVPKARLKAVQRHLLHELLERITPHEAAHGYRRGRSIATCVAPHAGRGVVLHLDLRSFFPSVRASRVHALFRVAGYPQAVARLLTGLCTNAVPAEVLRSRPDQERPADASLDERLLSRHLPQGAPTSPALANLCAYRLDCRLAGLARRVGASYTRYADDLVFSGEEDFARGLRRFHVHVCLVALEEGFEVNTRKSHFMRQGVRQQVAGIVLNVHPNLPRAEFDRLRAILTNCLRHGPGEQNRDGHRDFRGHLAGRVAYFVMINPGRGRRLRELFEKIDWPG